jgi:hypothetical protein
MRTLPYNMLAGLQYRSQSWNLEYYKLATHMDNPLHYFYGLCVLDVLDDHETRRTAKGSERLANKLRRETYSVMSNVTGISMGLHGSVMRAYMRVIDSYFGDGEAMKLYELVSALYITSPTRTYMSWPQVVLTRMNLKRWRHSLRLFVIDVSSQLTLNGLFE